MSSLAQVGITGATEPSTSPARSASRLRARPESIDDVVAKTTAAFEGALKGLIERMERLEKENTALRAEVNETHVRNIEATAAAGATIQAQSKIVTTLSQQLVEANSKIAELAGSLQQAIEKIRAIEGRHAGHTHPFSSPSSMGGMFEGLYTRGPTI